jgi:hypothetical protein
MRTLTKAVTALTFAAGILTTLGATNASADGAFEGCPSGAVCIYPAGTGWNGGHPNEFYYSYGAHNLSNDYGVHRIMNNQTGGATMRTCTGYNGTGCEGYMNQGYWIDKDMGPINSITLEP